MLTTINPSIAPATKSSTIDGHCIDLRNLRVACFYPDGKVEINGCQVTRIVQANTFSVGDLITIGSPYILADQSLDDRQAHAIVVERSASELFVTTLNGSYVPLPTHSKGSEGDVLWTSTAGGTVTTKPNSGLIFQRVGTVVDANVILLNIEHGVVFSS